MRETEKGINNQSLQTLRDDQIVTEKAVPRRSFLTATGAILVGGAAALVFGRTAIAQSQDPDKPRNPDPDKPQDPNKPQDPDKPRAQDPDKPRPQDPDQQDKTRSQDPDQQDKTKSQDPDKPKPSDPDKPRPDPAKFWR
jgi:hypothetical protein